MGVMSYSGSVLFTLSSVFEVVFAEGFFGVESLHAQKSAHAIAKQQTAAATVRLFFIMDPFSSLDIWYRTYGS